MSSPSWSCVPRATFCLRFFATGLAALALAGLCAACQPGPEGLAPGQPANVHVRLDFTARPLPEIPLPNDLATRFDATAATGRRLNASMVAPTSFERRTRELVDRLDGWGVFAPITIPFDGPLDVQAIADRHHGDDFAFANDAVYLIDVTQDSPAFGKPHELDLGNGNFPIVLEQLAGYWKGDVRGDTLSLLFDEHAEDKNGNGLLDPGEDTDLDGFLDRPNYRTGTKKAMQDMDLAERADALLTFYERESNTLIARPLVPLRERTTYAVVVTRRVLDEAGKPVGSPFEWIHHLAQTDALAPLPGILAGAGDLFGGLKLADIAFTWTFTTASIEADLRAVRAGLHGSGAQKHLAGAYPAEVDKVLPLFDDDAKLRPYENRFALSGESFEMVVQLLAAAKVVSPGGGEQKVRFQQALKYVSHHLFATFRSPQFFQRKDAAGRYLGYNDMSWPADLDRKKAADVAEAVTFWLTTPRKEATPSGKPHALVILGHGYTGNKSEVFAFHHYLARMGLAVVAIDNVSHGFALSAKDMASLTDIFTSLGIGNLAKALTSNRSWDQNVDGSADSGADFWTAYTFHTRDVVRQTAVDYMQLVRVLRGFDGKRLWPADSNGNGLADDLAGDVDGDGTVDVGGATMPIVMLGGSLGGIMASVMGGIEPEIAAVVPVAGGGGLIDVGLRSIQGGVREAVSLRLMGPLYVGVTDPLGSGLDLRTIVPNLNKTAEVTVARLDAAVSGQLAPGDSVRADNLDDGEYDCARLLVDTGCAQACAAAPEVTDKTVCPKRCLTFRVALASDVFQKEDAPKTPQRHKLTFWQGDAFVSGLRDPVKHRACSVKPGLKPVAVVDKFGSDVKFHHRSVALDFAKGAALSPLAEGLGLHRARPSLRRFLGFAQMVLDPADPAIYARHFHDDDLKTHALVLNTVGDMNVPVSTGAAIGRAAGLLDWKQKVPAWGNRTVNQVLVDTFVLEAVDKIPRFVDPAGNGILFDPEDLSGSATPSEGLPPAGTKIAFGRSAARGKDGFHAWRLNPPLHTTAVGKDRHGGFSGTFFPYVEPGGKHGFWEPGAHVEFLRKACVATGLSASVCNAEPYFDHGTVVLSVVGRFLASAGTDFSIEPCMSAGNCADVLPPPASRGD